MRQELQAHQLRVLEELRELNNKLVSLRGFIATSPAFQQLDMYEQRRMKRQADAMDEYARILQERIEAWLANG